MKRLDEMRHSHVGSNSLVSTTTASNNNGKSDTRDVSRTIHTVTTSIDNNNLLGGKKSESLLFPFGDKVSKYTASAELSVDYKGDDYYGNRVTYSEEDNSYSSWYSGEATSTSSLFNTDQKSSGGSEDVIIGDGDGNELNSCPDRPHYVVYSWILCMVSLAAFLKLYFLIKAVIIVILAVFYIVLIFIPFHHLFEDVVSNAGSSELR